MSHPDPLIVATATRIFARLCTPETVTAAESGTYPQALWQTLEDAGLSVAWVPEEHGGAGAGIADAMAIARAAGAAAAPVPLVETLLAGRLLAEAGLDTVAGPLCVAPTQATGGGTRGAPGDGTLVLGTDGRIRGTVRRIGFARGAGHLAAAVRAATGGDEHVVLVAREDLAIEPGTSLAGEPLDTVTVDGAAPLASAAAPGAADRLLALGAVARAQQIAGALAATLEITVQYAQDRTQFGRPIGKFQAVQHNLAMLAGEASAASAAADGAVAALAAAATAPPGAPATGTLVAVASAKVRAGEAAGAGAAIAHQVHGAIGFTREHRLHHLTRRLWAWRDDFEAETAWAIRLGETVCAAGADALWPELTAIAAARP